MTKFVFVDRYSALGIAPPDPKTMCKGECEGLGVYPQKPATPTPVADWPFVTCERCKGTGKEPRAKEPVRER